MMKDPSRPESIKEDDPAVTKLDIDFWRKERELAFAYVGEQSRWLVASLLVVNSGALFGLLGSELPQPVLTKSGSWFVAGIVCAFATGFSTWAAGIAGLVGTEPLTRADRLNGGFGAKRGWTDRTVGLLIAASLAAGVASVGMFAAGASQIAAALKRPPGAAANQSASLSRGSNLPSAQA
jgi:hypothetical protein